MKPSVVVIGSFMQDLAWRVDQFPRPGETRTGTFAAGPGGKGANQANAAARAGAAVMFMGAVGDDPFGAEAQRYYRREGVPAKWVVKKTHPTGTASILIDQAGQNSIAIAMGANEQLRLKDLDRKVIAQAKVVVCQFETNLKLTKEALAYARRHGATTILNPAPMRANLPAGLLKVVDILVPNETEFMALLESQGLAVPEGHQSPVQLKPEALDALCRKLGVPTVIVTLGEAGLFISSPEGWASLAACSVKAIDTTGAGDAFVGAFCAGLVRFDGELVKAAAFGNAAAALSVTRPGTSQSMPKLAQIVSLIRRQPIRLRSGARSS